MGQSRQHPSFSHGSGTLGCCLHPRRPLGAVQVAGTEPHSAHPMAGGRVAAPKTLLWGRNVWEHLSANKKSIKGARCLNCVSPGAYSSSPAP